MPEDAALRRSAARWIAAGALLTLLARTAGMVLSFFTLAPVLGLAWLPLGKGGFALDSLTGATGVLWALVAAFGIRAGPRWCAAASAVAWAFAVTTGGYLVSVVILGVLAATSEQRVYGLTVAGVAAAANAALLVLWASAITRTRAIARIQRLLHGDPEPAPRRAEPEDDEEIPSWDDR